MKPFFYVAAGLVAVVLLAALLIFVFDSDEEETLDPQGQENTLEGPRRGNGGAERSKTPKRIPWTTMTPSKSTAESELDRGTSVALIDSAGNPVRDAVILPFQSGKWGKARRTDDEGRFRFALPEHDGRLAVAAPGVLPQILRFDGGRLPESFRLETRLAAHLTVDVDGRPPEGPITLLFTPQLHTFANLFDLSRDEARFLRSVSPRFASWEGRTSDVGRLTLKGLLVKESFIVKFPAGLGSAERLNEDSRVFTLIPGEDVSIHLKTRPRLRGRLVQIGTLAPIAGARVSVLMPSDHDPSLKFRFSGVSDDAGLFVIELGASTVRETALEFGPGAESDPLPLMGPFEGVRDLGDIPVKGARRVVVVVTDTEGNPIAGARAMPEDESSLSPESDDQGRITWTGCPLSAQRLQVAALGFAPAWVSLRDDDAPTEVRLEASNRLRIRVIDDEGRPIPELTTLLEFSTMPFIHGSDGYPSALCARLMGFPPLPRTARSSYDRLRRPTDDEGRVEWGWLRPDVPVTVTVLDALKRVIASQAPLLLGATESRDLVFEMKSDHARSVEVQVQGADGAPAPGVLVMIRPVGKRAPSFGRATDASGVIRTPILLMHAPVAIEIFRHGQPVASYQSLELDGSDLRLLLPR